MSQTAQRRPRGATGPRRWGILFAAVWLFYLVSPLHAGWQRGGPVGWLGVAATLAFAAVYLAVFATMRSRRPGTPFRAPFPLQVRLALLAVEIALAVAMCLCVGQPGTAAAVYVAVTGVICLPTAGAWALAMVTGLVAYTAGFVVTGWEREDGIGFGVLAATLAVWGIARVVEGNIEMLRIREDNARLALADERNRFARDLHDLLGHSLTVITVKAELANRLLDVDLDRARAEVADLERLSRDALVDVRRAVQGYRELTLPGEIARARAALAAAEIQADLPNSTEVVPSHLRELFAWAIREGVTNVIRHSDATRCTVVLGTDSVEIRDDGRGADTDGTGAGLAGPCLLGHGLVGLRERASALGATVVARSGGSDRPGGSGGGSDQVGFSLMVVAR